MSKRLHDQNAASPGRTATIYRGVVVADGAPAVGETSRRTHAHDDARLGANARRPSALADRNAFCC